VTPPPAVTAPAAASIAAPPATAVPPPAARTAPPPPSAPVSVVKPAVAPPVVAAPSPSIAPAAPATPHSHTAPAPSERHAPTAPDSVTPQAAPAPRDITELLRDFDLPPLHDDAAKPASEFAAAKPRPGNGRWLRIAAAVVGVAGLGGGAWYVANASRKPAAPVLGTLSVQTNPPGVPVFVDGVARGNTPARISLNAGSHLLELRGRGVPRVIPVSITGGAEASQYLELPETPSVGSLLVQSDPPGARVTIDGVDRGPAPASVAGLTPGEHDVELRADGGSPVRQKVMIQAGVTASILAPVATAAPGPVSGWLTVKSAVTIEIRENGRSIGSSDTDKIMMAAGRHEVELVNETLGYRVSRTLQVPPGKVSSITVEMPQGTININASPWAEVFVDGRRAGETPIGNLPISIGPHEILFRHPQFGEKRQAVSVTLNAPVRLSVDMK
jgi:hypothetical protein